MADSVVDLSSLYLAELQLDVYCIVLQQLNYVCFKLCFFACFE